jgi:hypothetical protein
MSQGKVLGAKVFLEGKEVPYLGVTFTSTVGAASVAYVEVVPHYHINNVKPRTHVVISVRDYHNVEEEYPYILAWEGEVFGFDFSKNPEHRSVTLNCIDVSSYWDNVLTYFLNPQTSLGRSMSFVEVGQDYDSAQKQRISIQATVHSTASYFLNIMTASTKEKGDMLAGMIEVLKKIGDINDFYKNCQSRLRINDRILLKSSQKLTELLSEKEGLDWFSAVVGRESGFATLRDVIGDLMSIIFHDGTTIPFPGRTSGDKALTVPLPKNGQKKGANDTIGQFIFKPNLFMLPPPTCNIFFPDEYSSFQFSRNFFQEPTRLMYKPELPRPMDGSSPLALPLVYSPDALNNFMKGVKVPTGTEEEQVEADPGKFGDTAPGNVTTPIKRDAQFLTNEEKMKGILLAVESMVPASTAFRSALTDFQRKDFATRVAGYLHAKKRFESRQLQITSHLKLSVVPGFPVLLLDVSDADQNIIAYCSSVTHRITATEGGYTTTTLSYARTVSEQQSNGPETAVPYIPPWFDETIFGSVGAASVSEEAAKNLNEGFEGSQYVTPAGGKLTEFYKYLLGSKGSKALTDAYSSDTTLIGSVARLIGEYKAYIDKPGSDVHDFIRQWTDRDYIRLRDAMEFWGATTTTKDFRESDFTEFTGGVFSGGSFDKSQIAARQAIITKYRDALKAQRGFRG